MRQSCNLNTSLLAYRGLYHSGRPNSSCPFSLKLRDLFFLYKNLSNGTLNILANMQQQSLKNKHQFVLLRTPYLFPIFKAKFA